MLTPNDLIVNDRPPLIEACADCVLADGRIGLEEGKLLRAIAEGLGCPMPPLLTAVEKGWA